ncbi:MAG: selenium metabolism-associated LysR family transcriptional regulator [Nitrospinota bacterium]
MDIRQLEVFCQVVRSGSFSRAAKALGLSQPTASEHIKTLEEELGTRLFDRLGRRVQPTPAGMVLTTHAQRILQEREKARAAIEEFMGRVRGSLFLAASTIPGGYLLPSMLGGFKKCYPETTVNIRVLDSRRVAEGVLEGAYQIGFSGARIPNSQLVYEFFARDELLLAVPPDHPLAGRPRIRAEELAGVKLLVREEGSGTRSVAEDRLGELGFALKPDQVAAVLGNPQAVRTAIKAGVGVAIVSRFSVREDLASGALREVPIQGFECAREFYSLVHKARSLSPLGRSFLDYVRANKPPAS